MRVALIVLLLVNAGCATVHQADLDAWQNQPVEKLDTHSFWTTIPMKKVVTKDGTEHRFYINSNSASKCFGNSSVRSSFTGPQIDSVQNCVSEQVTCNNIFKIKNDIVLSYEPKGKCKTADFLRPE